MNNLLYTVAMILIIGWLIGVFGFHASGPIHWLLLIALVAVIWKLVKG